MTGIFDYILLIIGILFLGLLIAFSPTIYITQIAILKKSKQPLLHTIALLLGIIISSLIFTLIVWLFANPDSYKGLSAMTGSIKNAPLFDIVLGTFLIFASYQINRPKGSERVSIDLKYEKLLNTKSLFWFGLIRTSTRLSSFAAIMIFVRLIKTYYTNQPVTQVMSLMLLLVISITPLVITALLEKISPESYKKVISVTGKFEAYNWNSILSTLFMIVGLIFMFSGILNLVK